jgi:hypothetical protein
LLYKPIALPYYRILGRCVNSQTHFWANKGEKKAGKLPEARSQKQEASGKRGEEYKKSASSFAPASPILLRPYSAEATKGFGEPWGYAGLRSDKKNVAKMAGDLIVVSCKSLFDSKLRKEDWSRGQLFDFRF